MKKIIKRNLIATIFSIAAFSVANLTTNSVSAQEWIPRTVEEIRANLEENNEKTSYTIQYGDTLSTIAEAMGIDLSVLASINNIENIHLIYPGVSLTTVKNSENEIAQVIIEEPAPEEVRNEVTVDLQENTLTINNETVPLEEATSTIEDTGTANSLSEEIIQDNSETSTVYGGQTSDYGVTSTIEDIVVEEIPAPVEQVAEVSSPSIEQTYTEAQPVETIIENAQNNQVVNTPVVDTYNLSQSAALYKQTLVNTFGVTNIGGYRAGDPGDHGTGKALDVMVPVGSQLGNDVANFAISNMAANNISYVIWNQRFYAPYNSIYGPAYTWNLMPDRGSITQNHYDHVHISFN